MKLTENDLDRYLERDPGGDDYIFDITDYAPRTRELIRLARLGLWSEQHAIPKLKEMAEIAQYDCNCDILSQDVLDKLPQNS